MFPLLRSTVMFKNVEAKRVSIRLYKRMVSKCNHSKRIFSGIQPTGNVHLGNYLGAIRNWVQLQDSGENVLWSIVDMHSITLPHDPKELYESVLKITATLLACGIDPKRSILFQQSAIPMHAELCWVLGCITTLARLAHLPQFKEKSETLKNVPLGLYIYPVLQAADILLYRATHVPVGQDQVRHIQLAQDLAISFNKKFGDTFPIPHSLINDDASQRIKSLRDPLKKMSKSSLDSKSKIDIVDEPNRLLENIKKAVTDCTSEVTYEPEKRPGVANLISIHSMLTGKMPSQICLEAQGLDTGKYVHAFKISYFDFSWVYKRPSFFTCTNRYKLALADLIIEKLSPIREEFSKLIKEPAYLEQVLKGGREKATEIATNCWHQVRENVGFANNTYLNEKKCKKYN
ncbi:tryptophan--tRNA ligase, mitochondrial isoform X1 [Hylaeus volcanicus]|uniref:tryptophan--tRNA ligase, mitochondrial isoform X1 n=2 Tax=Hylaeus volcanicus TaxID=313075 RepID=UPI0023B7FADA|nr:tryptophan--tRNA ligase, mitochondrial isoform X1 [Hylaeus volcanicus]